MHGGATPRGARHGAFVHGEHTIEAIAERRRAVALNETATELLFEAFRAQTDVALRLRRELLRSEEAEAQREAIKVQVAAALAMRERAAELRDGWTRRWLMTKRKPRVKPKLPGGAALVTRN
jgi:anthranilate phosphoribosyltransferase